MTYYLHLIFLIDRFDIRVIHSELIDFIMIEHAGYSFILVLLGEWGGRYIIFP